MRCRTDKKEERFLCSKWCLKHNPIIPQKSWTTPSPIKRTLMCLFMWKFTEQNFYYLNSQGEIELPFSRYLEQIWNTYDALVKKLVQMNKYIMLLKFRHENSLFALLCFLFIYKKTQKVHQDSHLGI